MLVAKQVADLVTATRALIAFWLAWLGITQGEAALYQVAWLLVLSWTSDALDGPLARRSSRIYPSWLGDHDLEIDMLVSLGLLVYMLGSGYFGLAAAALYLTAWALLFWRWDLVRSLGMLFQAPIYAGFLVVALAHAPAAGLLVVAWILAAVILSWPKFPQEIVPGFLAGFQELRR